MPALSIDPLALIRFLVRSQGQLVQMQSLLVNHAPIVDARDLRRIVQSSREIASGAEVAGLGPLARAATDIESLAEESLRSTASDPVQLAARMSEHLRALGARLEAEFQPEGG